jgi:hypothetical protein
MLNHSCQRRRHKPTSVRSKCYPSSNAQYVRRLCYVATCAEKRIWRDMATSGRGQQLCGINKLCQRTHFLLVVNPNRRCQRLLPDQCELASVKPFYPAICTPLAYVDAAIGIPTYDRTDAISDSRVETRVKTREKISQTRVLPCATSKCTIGPQVGDDTSLSPDTDVCDSASNYCDSTRPFECTLLTTVRKLRTRNHGNASHENSRHAFHGSITLPTRRALVWLPPPKMTVSDDTSDREPKDDTNLLKVICALSAIGNRSPLVRKTSPVLPTPDWTVRRLLESLCKSLSPFSFVPQASSSYVSTLSQQHADYEFMSMLFLRVGLIFTSREGAHSTHVRSRLDDVT